MLCRSRLCVLRQQVVGSIMGCVIAPLTFLLFYKAFDVGVPGSAYPAPYATIYRAMAILGIEARDSPFSLASACCVPNGCAHVLVARRPLSMRTCA